MGFEAELRAPSADTFETFIREWYGDEAVDVRELPAAVPARLRRFYELFGKHETVNLHLVPPGELALATSSTLFAVEEQGVFAYAVGQGEHDPSVFGTWDVEFSRWEREGERLGRFLLQYALYEAALGWRHGGWGWVDVARQPRAGRLCSARADGSPGVPGDLEHDHRDE